MKMSIGLWSSCLLVALFGMLQAGIARERGPRVEVVCPSVPVPVRVVDKQVLAYTEPSYTLWYRYQRPQGLPDTAGWIRRRGAPQTYFGMLGESLRKSSPTSSKSGFDLGSISLTEPSSTFLNVAMRTAK